MNCLNADISRYCMVDYILVAGGYQHAMYSLSSSFLYQRVDLRGSPMICPITSRQEVLSIVARFAGLLAVLQMNQPKC